jgi:hypothetical protein
LAQNEGNHQASQPKGRLAWFVYTSLPEGLENPVSVMSGKDISQVLLCKLSPSDPVKIPADGILRVVRKIENPAEPEKPAYLTLAQATVPDSVAHAMIILMPIAKNPQGLLFQTKVQDLDGLKRGDCMFLNITNMKIAVELGKATIGVAPGKAEIHNPLNGDASANLRIRVSFFHPERQKWSMITTSNVAIYSTRRELWIFNWDERFKRVVYESITFPGGILIPARARPWEAST